MSSVNIYIVIPVHNKIELTLKCLASLEGQSYPQYEIIVVDDGSTDGTYETIQKRFPEVTLLQGDGNLWWTGGTNMGVEYALKTAKDNDFVLTLNNDLEIGKDYLEQLLKVYQQFKPCLVGSVSVNSQKPEQVEFLGSKNRLITGRSRLPIKEILPYSTLKQTYDVLESDVLPGRGTLIPIPVFKKIGLFDFEHFPQYIADYDFSKRAKYAGFKLLVSTKAVVKSVVESTGVTYVIDPTFKTFFKGLTSIKSPTQMKIRYYWAIRHSPIGILYFFFSMTRVFLSFIRAYLFSLRQK
ncbi:glycosyltransferase family 2 protein [Catalinimonas niigatensis]|uniref:glycosyltransferase family 2 protein n=1 Tax=Catalinimonas niigatensis TaxID=1397264 RepID=UPI002666FEDE|nr:glycosyltransferase family 2 protein [Catalinimonas niigatensis]WPP50277.1 glycosyltransferase family 2 protein [Catalinimonas niigatensis]